MNSHDAVAAARRCTRADSDEDDAELRDDADPSTAGRSGRSCCSSDGDEATNQAVTAVMARPAHIQP